MTSNGKSGNDVDTQRSILLVSVKICDDFAVAEIRNDAVRATLLFKEGVAHVILGSESISNEGTITEAVMR